MVKKKFVILPRTWKLNFNDFSTLNNFTVAEYKQRGDKSVCRTSARMILQRHVISYMLLRWNNQIISLVECLLLCNTSVRK